MRDEFVARTKGVIARRAGTRCSNPDHGVVTSGPHDDPRRAISTGVAAHITAASPGGYRYDPAMSEPERTSAENGIWLCQNCATLVDRDATQYTVDVLRSWKRRAEARAELEIRTSRSIHTDTGEDKVAPRNLATLRDRVKQFWIRGVLENSVQREALIALSWKPVNSAVDHPWANTVELPGEEPNLVSPAKRTSEVFRECGRALLILGEPGSGKTLTLLDLAHDLINDAELDSAQPVPVVFNLSNWSLKRPPLFTWLVEELNAKYFCPKKLAEFWLEQNWILLLLDGLDEMAATAQADCVAAVHNYLSEHGTAGIAVCCRTKGYAALPLRLKLNAAIALQPLDNAQIEQYLRHAGEGLSALRQAMAADTTIQELARTPLWLSIMSLAYQETTPEQLAEGAFEGTEQRREHILRFYTEKMLARRTTASTPFAKQQTLKWLGWLARYLLKKAETIFLVEALQPDCLDEPSQQKLYIGISRGLSGALFVACLIVLGATLVPIVSASMVLAYAAYMGAVAGLCACAVEVFILGPTQDALSKTARQPRVKPRIRLYLIAFFVGTLVWPLLEYRLRVILLPKSLLLLLLANALLCAVLLGLPLAFVFERRAKWHLLAFDIQTAEHLTWSWQQGRKRLLWGATWGLLVVLICGAIVLVLGPFFIVGSRLVLLGVNSFPHRMPTIVDTIAAVVCLLLGGLGGASVSLLFGGFGSSMTARKTKINQGIHLSIRTATLAGVLVASGAGALSWFWLCFLNPDFPAVRDCMARLERAAVAGGAAGSIAALWCGGIDIIQHYILRFLLWKARCTPWKFGVFLDQACRTQFLQRVGGGRMFIHRALLTYFAKLGEENVIAEKNAAVCLVWKCPQCEQTTDFQSIEYVSDLIPPSSRPSDPTRVLHLRCAGCRYEIPVEPSEIPMIDRAHEITTQFKQRRLTVDGYRDQIGRLQASFVQALAAASWKCLKCGEENPAGFDSCWNCAAKDARDQPTITEDTKPSPHSQLGGNPWEN